MEEDEVSFTSIAQNNIDEVKKKSAELQKTLMPIIDNWAVLMIMKKHLAPKVGEGQTKELEDFYIGLIHKILNYELNKKQ